MTVATEAAERMIGDATLVALLSTYRGQPAVFVADEGTLPEDADPPYVIVLGADSVEPDDTKTTRGRDEHIVIGCFDRATGSTSAINAIAERIRELFHRHPLGEHSWLAEVSGPYVYDPDDDEFYARAMRVRNVSSVDA